MLKKISYNELNFHESYTNGSLKIKKMPFFEKYMLFFWFLGPIIYLIERDPADVWLSLIGVIFLIRSFIKKDWIWLKQTWFKFTLLFWLIAMISGLLSIEPVYSFTEAFIWIRFPIYAVAAQSWLAKDRDIKGIMFLSICLGMICMSSILILEILFENKNRLTWPYGDALPGSYLAKVCLPVFCTFIALITRSFSFSKVLLFSLVILVLLMTILTGERVSALILVCSSILAGLVWKPKKSILLILIVSQLLVFLGIVSFSSNLKSRLTNHFLTSIPLIGTIDHGVWPAWRGGIQQGLETPIIGVGPSMTRKRCDALQANEPKWLPGKNLCANHPHNFYIQLFAETGIFGLIFGSFMILSIIIKCFNGRLDNSSCPMIAISFIVPLAFFFPIQQFGNFFGQWGNLFIWFAIGFSLSNSKTKLNL